MNTLKPDDQATVDQVAETGEVPPACILEDATDDGVIMVNGKPYMENAKGALIPKELIKPTAQLEDETVRKIIRFARALSDQIARFRGHGFTDLGELEALLEQEYGLAKGGAKGNKTFMTVDGLQKVTVQVADFIAFGPELQIAKGLIDECLNEWAADSCPEIRAVVTRAFNTDKEGQINRSELFMLMRLDIEDERWKRAVKAIREAMRIIGSRQYIRFYQRKTQQDRWEPITIDLAKAG